VNNYENISSVLLKNKNYFNFLKVLKNFIQKLKKNIQRLKENFITK
jgi:hypothetical protein